MKLNKYRLGSTINYNFTSPEEYQQRSMYMRGMHDLTQQAILNQEKELQIEYADVDDQYVSPKIEYLQNKLNNLTQKVAKGYNPKIADELVQTRREYLREAGPKGTIGRAQSNYKAMQQALADYDKAHPKDPEWFREVNKKNIIANYKGMQDEAGNFVEFTPGRATGYRDVGEDAIEYLKSAGASDQDLNLVREGKLKITPIKDAYGNPYMQVEQLVPGNYRSNVQNLKAGLNQLQSEWLNPETDRGLSGQLAGYTPEYITGTLSNIGNMLTKNVMSDQPRWSGSLQKVDKPNTSSTGNQNVSNLLNRFQQYPVQNIEQYTKDIDKKYDKFLETYNEETGEFEVPINSRYQNFTYIAPGIVAQEKVQEHPIKTINREFREVEKQFSQIKDKVMSKDGFTMTTLSGETKTFKGKIKDFLEAAREIEKYYTATMGTELGLNNKDLETNIMRSVKEIPGEDSFVNSNNPSETLTKAEAEERMAPTGQLQVRVNARGEFLVQLKNKKGDSYEDYIINPKALPTQSKEYDRDIESMLDYIRKFNLDDNTIKMLNSGVFEFNVNGTPIRYMIEVNKDNPIEKNIVRLEQTPNGIYKVPTTMAEIQAINVLNKYQSIQPLK